MLRTVTFICKHCLKIHDSDVSSSFVADKEEILGLKAAMHNTTDWFTFTNAVTVLQCSNVALIVTSSLSSESDLRVLVCFSTNARCNIARGCVFSTSLVSLSTLSANWSVLRCWNSRSVLLLLHLPLRGGDEILTWWMSKLKSLIYLLYKLYWHDDVHFNSRPL